MAYRVETTREAETEALEIFVWKGEHGSFEAATRWYNGLIDALHTLEDHPQRCSLAPENEFFREEIRQLLYGARRDTYRILFTIGGSTVYVLHIRHSAMRPLQPESEGNEQ